MTVARIILVFSRLNEGAIKKITNAGASVTISVKEAAIYIYRPNIGMGKYENITCAAVCLPFITTDTQLIRQPSISKTLATRQTALPRRRLEK